MPKKKGTKSLDKTLSIRTGHRTFVDRTIESTDAVLETSEEQTATKLKQLKLTLKEELETLKHLDANVVELTEDEEEIFKDISDAGAFSVGL